MSKKLDKISELVEIALEKGCYEYAIEEIAKELDFNLDVEYEVIE